MTGTAISYESQFKARKGAVDFIDVPEYLGDPRRSAPEKLRTIIRHPVAPVSGLA